MQDIQGFYFGADFFEQYYRGLTKSGPALKELRKMKDVMIYELVNTKIRDALDLTSVENLIWESIAFTYPEATNIVVFDSFYSFTIPVLLRGDKIKKAQHLGRVIAKKMPALAQLAMRSYESKNHAKSNQLFKAVKGARRLEYCRTKLEESGVY